MKAATSSASVGALRFAGQPRSAQIYGEAGEVLGVLRDLEGIASLVGREIRDEHQRLALALDLVIDINAVRLHRRHPGPLSIG